MNCKDCTDQVLLYAAGALGDDEAAEVREHLGSGCPRCAGRLAEAEATLSLLALTLPPDMPSEQARQKLLERIAGEKRPIAAPLKLTNTMRFPAPQTPWWMQLAVPSAIAAAIAAAATIFFTTRLEQRNAQVDQGAVASFEKTIGVLTSTIQQKEHELTQLRSSGGAQTVQWASDRGLKFLWLDGTAQQPAGAGGRIFWDTDRGVWHFFANGLKPAPAGKAYELWFVTSDGKTLPAGQFNPSDDGEASIVAPVAPDATGKFAAAAVTDEAIGSTDTRPSGTYQLMLAQR